MKWLHDEILKNLIIPTVRCPCHCWCPFSGIFTQYYSVSKLWGIYSCLRKLVNTHSVAAQSNLAWQRGDRPNKASINRISHYTSTSFTWIRNLSPFDKWYGARFITSVCLLPGTDSARVVKRRYFASEDFLWSPSMRNLNKASYLALSY